MNETNYKANFIFSKDVPYFIRTKAINEFVRVRGYAVDLLNPHYEEWNAQFNAEMHEVYENDELDYLGGKAYVEFITKKQREVIDRVNKKHLSTFIDLDIDEECDIIGRCKFDKDITVSLYLTPIN